MCVIWSVAEFADNVNDLFVVLCYLAFCPRLVSFASFSYFVVVVFYWFFFLCCGKNLKTKAKWNDKVSRIINKHNEIRSKYQWKIKSLHLDSLCFVLTLFFFCAVASLGCRCWREVHFSCVFDLTITQQRPDVAVAMQTYKVTRLLHFFFSFFHSLISAFYRTLLHRFQQFSIR